MAVWLKDTLHFFLTLWFNITISLYHGSRKRNNTTKELVVAQLHKGGVLTIGVFV
jgi:hypothetical protein